MLSETTALQAMLDNEQATINELIQEFVDLGTQIREINDQIREQVDVIQANSASLVDMQKGLNDFEKLVKKLESQISSYDKDLNLDASTIERREAVKEV